MADFPELSFADLDYVRLLIGDTDTDRDAQLFTDRDLNMVAHHEGSLKRAAAQLLDRIAGSELLLSKKIQTQDLSTDGPAVARELRALAAELRAQDAGDRELESGWGLAVFTFADSPPGRPEGTEAPW